jgi:hypothetical protein
MSSASRTETAAPYPIGRPGEPWGEHERALWRARQVRQRRYADLVLPRVTALGRAEFEAIVYGEAQGATEPYPLMALRSRSWLATRPSVLITGGVHGYETSGVLGALAFAERFGNRSVTFSADAINLLIAPCVSPWAFEHVQRWNADAIDPNRNFREHGPAEEATALVRFIADQATTFALHIDLHETTDTDETEFRPAKSARDGEFSAPGEIPDGFYLVGDTRNPQLEFQQHVIDAVSRVTHIAPADANGQIIGADVVAPGVILYALHDLGLCAGITGARFTTTTEVYPDSPRVTPEQCIEAQVTAVEASIRYLLTHGDA